MEHKLLYIHTEAVVLCVHVRYYYLLSQSSAMKKRKYTVICSLPRSCKNFLMTSCIDSKCNFRTYVTTVRGLTTP